MKIERRDGYQEDHEVVANQYSQMTRLSPREAEAYVLLVFGELSEREVAEEMGVAQGTVKSMKGSIRNKIRVAKETAELEL